MAASRIGQQNATGPAPKKSGDGFFGDVFGAVGDFLGFDGSFGYQGDTPTRSFSFGNLGDAFSGGASKSSTWAASTWNKPDLAAGAATENAAGLIRLFDPDTNLRKDITDYIRGTGTDWAINLPATPADAPNMIDLSRMNDQFGGLMSQSYLPDGRLIERGGTFFLKPSGDLSLGNIGGRLGGAGSDGFTPDLEPYGFLGVLPSDQKTVGVFHTHPYEVFGADGRRISAAFSGQDFANMLNLELNFSVVQSGDTQWMLLRTGATPTLSRCLDPDGVERVMSSERSRLGAPTKISIPTAQSAVISSAASAYNVVFYKGEGGVFKRVN